MGSSGPAAPATDFKTLARSRPIVLIGMRGVGKTTVGRFLAEELGRKFLDLDARTLRQAQRVGDPAPTVAALFFTGGEARFRDLESAALRAVLEPGIKCVLATGGGALERLDNRTWLARAGACVWLEESLEVIQKRVAAGGDSRPSLLGDGDPADELATLFERRRADYASLASLRIDGAGRPAREIAREIVRETT